MDSIKMMDTRITSYYYRSNLPDFVAYTYETQIKPRVV